MNEHEFVTKLIDWYIKNRRDLPWRETNDPYKIWLSEIILQQTRVNQGLPYYHKFIDQYPNVYSLAAAPQQEVLRLWQGLGYYSRARNLHTCAKTIVNQYNGYFPDNYNELLKLKGIGPYTAAAIASFAYNEKVPVVDGNVFRVLARVFGEDKDILSTKGQKRFKELAESLLPEDKGYLYNQAIMEFGALQCVPQNPDCRNCPLQNHCYAYKQGIVDFLPVKRKKTKKRIRYFHYLVFRYNQALLMKQRAGKDIWAGLFDFYLVEKEFFFELTQLNDPWINNEYFQENCILKEKSGVYTHQLTHQKLMAKFFLIEIVDRQFFNHFIENTNFVFFDASQIEALPKPILIENYLRTNYF